MMNKLEIAIKADELMDEWLADRENKRDAVNNNFALLELLIDAPLSEIVDARTNLLIGMERYAKACKDFEDDAKDALLAELGGWKRVDVDHEEWIGV
jgi:hypothetical protein